MFLKRIHLNLTSDKFITFLFRFGPRFPPASQSYSLKLRQFAKKVAKDIGFESFVREGVYCYLGGPSFETVTECRFLKIAGVDATGTYFF